MEFLGDKYGARRKRGEDMLWNQANHRLLEEDDLDELAQNYGIRPWQFVQREVPLAPSLTCLSKRDRKQLSPGSAVGWRRLAGKSKYQGTKFSSLPARLVVMLIAFG